MSDRRTHRPRPARSYRGLRANLISPKEISRMISWGERIVQGMEIMLGHPIEPDYSGVGFQHPDEGER